MDDLELIFSMLGERVSTEITRKEDAQGINDDHNHSHTQAQVLYAGLVYIGDPKIEEGRDGQSDQGQNEHG